MRVSCLQQFTSSSLCSGLINVIRLTYTDNAPLFSLLCCLLCSFLPSCPLFNSCFSALLFRPFFSSIFTSVFFLSWPSFLSVAHWVAKGMTKYISKSAVYSVTQTCWIYFIIMSTSKRICPNLPNTQFDRQKMLYSDLFNLFFVLFIQQKVILWLLMFIWELALLSSLPSGSVFLTISYFVGN